MVCDMDEEEKHVIDAERVTSSHQTPTYAVIPSTTTNEDTHMTEPRRVRSPVLQGLGQTLIAAANVAEGHLSKNNGVSRIPSHFSKKHRNRDTKATQG